MGSIPATHMAAATPCIDCLIVDRGFDDIGAVIEKLLGQGGACGLYRRVCEPIETTNAINFLKAGFQSGVHRDYRKVHYCQKLVIQDFNDSMISYETSLMRGVALKVVAL